MIGGAAVVVAVLLASVAQGYRTYNTGAGIVYRLSVTHDVTLERGYYNYNWLQYLLVSKHPDYPNKRSLVQFENLPSSCTHVKSAKMYLYYVYAHKASWHPIQKTPFIARYMQVTVTILDNFNSSLMRWG